MHEIVFRAKARLWLLKPLGGWDWGLNPYLFLRVVTGVILPMMFYGAQCWASVLCLSMRLVELDSVLAYAARMAFRLERTTSVEASLALNGIESVRYHILRILVYYLVQWCRKALVDSSSNPIHCRRVTPFKLGRSWFQRSVWGRTLSSTIPIHHQYIHRARDRALRAELSRRWTSSKTGRALKDGFRRFGEAWTMLDAARGSRSTTLIVARFLVGHCHIGTFCIPWDLDECVVCPWCGDAFTHDHFIWLCRGMSQEKRVLLRESAHTELVI